MSQKAVKPKVHELAQQKLNGEVFENFTQFLDFLKQEKVNTPWKSTNGYYMKYKSCHVGSISISEGENRFSIGLYVSQWNAMNKSGEFAKQIAKNGLKEFVCNNLQKCTCTTRDTCIRVNTIKNVFDEEVTNICGSSGHFHVSINTPKEQEINDIKKLIIMIKSVIEEEKIKW